LVERLEIHSDEQSTLDPWLNVNAGQRVGNGVVAEAMQIVILSNQGALPGPVAQAFDAGAAFSRLTE